MNRSRTGYTTWAGLTEKVSLELAGIVVVVVVCNMVVGNAGHGFVLFCLCIVGCFVVVVHMRIGNTRIAKSK